MDMSTTELSSPDVDHDLEARLQRLTEQRATQSKPSRMATPSPSRGRRHPARKSRSAALVLSLATTGGLTAGFAATDGPSSSVVAASGGVVSSAASPVTAATSAAPSVGSTGVASAPSVIPVAPSTTAAAVSVVNGDVYANKFGPVQVQATFASDGSITAVNAVQVPSSDSKSVRINDRAVPTLNTAALTAQNAQVNTVSGATYTSVDYERSLQSAIDAARSAGLTELG